MPYILNTEADRKAMLDKIGVASIDALFKMVPDAFQLRRPLSVPDALARFQSGPLDRPLFSFWFDDGFLGVRRHAAPIPPVSD